MQETKDMLVDFPPRFISYRFFKNSVFRNQDFRRQIIGNVCKKIEAVENRPNRALLDQIIFIRKLEGHQ